MPKSRWLILLGTLLIPLAALPAPKPSEKVVVYVYDSFLGKESLGSFVAEALKTAKGIETEYVSFPNAGEALNQVALEGKDCRADLLVGVDGSLAARAQKLDAFAPIESAVWERLEPGLAFDPQRRFLPFDFGYLALVYDSKRVTTLPAGLTLAEFARRPQFRKKLVIEDPRTSSIGLSFLVWTGVAFPGPGLEAFWRNLSAQLVTVSPGWSGAYGLFLKAEADFVVSYTTSPAYHLKHDGSDATRAVLFKEGHFRQVESVAQLKKANPRAREWVETLLSDSAQTALPERQWLYPAVRGIALPASFQKLPPPPTTLSVDWAVVERARPQWLRQWPRWVATKP